MEINYLVIEQTGKSKWENDNDAESGKYKVGDFILQVQVDVNEGINRQNGKWLRVELIIDAKERGEDTDVVIQLKPLKDNSPPPFEIDTIFLKHFKSCYNNSNWKDILDKKQYVKKEFIDQIVAEYKPKP